MRTTNLASSGVSAPYHAYDARDFMRVKSTWRCEQLVDGLRQSDQPLRIRTASGHRRWANNHSNYNGGGEYGALYNNGTFMASDTSDPMGISITIRNLEL